MHVQYHPDDNGWNLINFLFFRGAGTPETYRKEADASLAPEMDVVKLWSSLLANCAIGTSSVCSIPTAYFVQGTADVQFLAYATANNNNNNEDDNNIESLSIADSDSDNSCYLTGAGDERVDATIADDDDEEDEEEEEEDEEDEDNGAADERDRHLVPVKIVEEIVEDGSGGDYDREEVRERATGAKETGDKQKKRTQGKQTQTKIHRNR